MTTALDLIKRARRLNRTLGAGEIISAEESANGLTALNAMMDAWSVQRLFVYQITEDSAALVAGTASYTIGASGVINTTRPERIEPSSYVRLNGVDFNLSVMTDAEYNSISSKTTQGLPAGIYYSRAVPLGTLFFYPVPDAAYTLKLRSWKRLQTFAALPDVLALPAGYEEAIVFSLAETLAAEDGIEPSMTVVRKAAGGRKALQPNNAARFIMTNDVTRVLGQQSPFDIRTGYW